jgi:hypothetical protein
MPEIGLDEADRCVYCGRILHNPPNCCKEAIADYENDIWEYEAHTYIPEENVY